jgi:hypothetical protein
MKRARPFRKEQQFDWMRLDSALKKSRPHYISAQKVSTLFDALDEREIARSFSDARAFMAVPVSYYT